MSKRPTEIVSVPDKATEARCDGGLGALGHPLVFLPFDGAEAVDCYYCSRRFIKQGARDRLEAAGRDVAAPLEELIG